VEVLNEILFSGSVRFLDPNSILCDESSRRTSSTSTGKRKVSIDHLLLNFMADSGARRGAVGARKKV
jgi:hypothetical protein